MLIYNITTKIDWSIDSDWVDWMKREHIPAVMSTNKFEKYQLVKLLDIEDDDGPTYAIQYFVASQKQYEEYLEFFADNFRNDLVKKWGNKFIAFRSLMQVLD